MERERGLAKDREIKDQHKNSGTIEDRIFINYLINPIKRVNNVKLSRV